VYYPNSISLPNPSNNLCQLPFAHLYRIYTQACEPLAKASCLSYLKPTKSYSMSSAPLSMIGRIKVAVLQLLRFLSNILKSIWLFFPSLLFVLLAMMCFLRLSQGKDLLIAFTENSKARIFFLIAISFWVYVTWYSSRIVAYLKKEKQRKYANQFGPI